MSTVNGADDGRPQALPNLRSVGEVLKQFVRVVSPPTLRSSWTSSRIGIYADGTTATVLLILAQEKYGHFDLEQWMPYWKDRSWDNESWENVELVERASGGKLRRNPFGVPSGTKEYWTKYRQANRERVREYQRKSAERRRELEKKVKEQDLQFVEGLLGQKKENVS